MDIPMTTRLMPYGATDQANNLSKVGKKITSPSLAARMPSAEIAAKVGVRAVISNQQRRVVRIHA